MKKFIGGLGFLVALNLLSKPLWILVEQSIQDRVGHAAYGLYAALTSLSLILLPLLDPGLNQSALTQLAANREKYPRLVGQTLTLKALMLLVYLPVLLGMGIAVGYRGGELWVLLAVGALQALIMALGFARSLFQAFQRFVTDGLISVSDKVLLMLVVVVLLATGTLTFNSFIVALLVCTGAAALGFQLYAFRRFGAVDFKLGWPIALEILRNSWPFAVLVLLTNLNERMNQIILERTLGEEANGVYAAAYRWFAAFTMYLWTILPVFYARFASRTQHPPAEQQMMLNLATPIAAIPLIFVGGFCFFYSEKLFFLFQHSAPEQLAEMAQHLKFQAITLVVIGIFNPYATFLTATGKERFVNRWLAAAIVVNAATQLLLAPVLGGVSASAGLLASYSLLSLSYVVHIQRDTPVRVSFSILFKLIVLTAGTFGGWAFCQSRGWYWLYSAIAVGALALALSLAFFLKQIRENAKKIENPNQKIV